VVLTAAISANSVQAAPAVLAKTATAVALAKGATASTSTLTLIKGALKVMAWTKAKTAVVAGAALILTAGTTTVIVKSSGQKKPTTSPAAQQPITMGYSQDGSASSFKEESIRRMNESKQWALAFMMFANDHRNQLPKSFDEVKKSKYVRGTSLSDSNLDVVSSGNLKNFKDPASTILLREKTSRKYLDGKFFRGYTFADGHAEMISSPDDNFESVEKLQGFLIVSAKN
jgi:hypothetical protein